MTDGHVRAFVDDGEDRISELRRTLSALESDPDDDTAVDAVFRAAHTLKGNAAATGFGDVSGLAHALEDALETVRDGEVDVTPTVLDLLFEAVDRLAAMLGEIDATGETSVDASGTAAALRTLARGSDIGDGTMGAGTGSPAGKTDRESDAGNSRSDAASRGSDADGDADDTHGLRRPAGASARADVAGVEGLRGLAERVVSDLAREQGKRVDVVVESGDVRLDREPLAAIRDPLVHALRNAVDHGIEPPAARDAAGKDPVGTIALDANRDGEHVAVAVEDDGRGIDADAVREAAVEEGVTSREAAGAMDDAAARELVFQPGLSTTDAATAVSGRGVGMDIVRTAVCDLDGSVTLESTPGEGTRLEMRLSVASAAARVLFVAVDGVAYGVPVADGARVVRTDGIDVADGAEVVRHDGTVYPVVRLPEAVMDASGRADTAVLEDGDATSLVDAETLEAGR